MFNDIPVECKFERHECGINIYHLVSLDEGKGHAKEALMRVVQFAQEEGLEYVVVNIGNSGSKNSAEFLRRIGFTVIESSRDRVTAEIELSNI